MSTHYKFILLSFLSSLFLFTACGDDDTVIPQDEELITTVAITLSPTNSGADIFVTYVDLDGDGGQPPLIETMNLAPNTTYQVSVNLINQAANPAEEITEEILAEAEAHQLFYEITTGLALTITYQDQDAAGNPLGLLTNFTTAEESTGNLTITLRHEPNKGAAGVADGQIANAGGETDIEVVFPVEIQ